MRRSIVAVLLPLIAAGCVAGSGAGPTGTGFVQAGRSAAAIGSPAEWSPPAVPSVAGTGDVLTVSQALAARDRGDLGHRSFVLVGYWSVATMGWSCPAPVATPGDLELWCRDTRYGVTERYEAAMTTVRDGNTITWRPADGPVLTPWVPENLGRRLFDVPPAGTEAHAPVPVALRGHFDDARSSACQSGAVTLCRNRFVIEEVLAFDPGSAPTATAPPAPTPFPASPPPGLFPAEACGGAVPHAFVGWTRSDALHSTISHDAQVWAAVTRDVVPAGTWGADPGHPDHFSLPMARLVCAALESVPGGIEYGAVLGTAYRLWDDGRRTPDDLFGAGSGDRSLPDVPEATLPPVAATTQVHGPSLPAATIDVRDWSGTLQAARPATASELATAGATTDAEHGAAAVVLQGLPHELLLVWAQCGSDRHATVIVTADRGTIIVNADVRSDCGDPGARRGAVLTFAAGLPAVVTAVTTNCSRPRPRPSAVAQGGLPGGQNRVEARAAGLRGRESAAHCRHTAFCGPRVQCGVNVGGARRI